MEEKKKVTKKATAVELPTGSLDLKESREMLKGFSLVVSALSKATADGKLSLSDAKFALDLVKEYQVFIDAAQDLKLIPAELKDLDQAEMLILATDIYPILKDIKTAILNLKK